MCRTRGRYTSQKIILLVHRKNAGMPWKRVRGTEAPYAINGYRNGCRKKNSISRAEWSSGGGASGFMNEISFPEKTPPIRAGLESRTDLFLGIQADRFVRCFVRELESPSVHARRSIKRFTPLPAPPSAANLPFVPNSENKFLMTRICLGCHRPAPEAVSFQRLIRITGKLALKMHRGTNTLNDPCYLLGFAERILVGAYGF